MSAIKEEHGRALNSRDGKGQTVQRYGQAVRLVDTRSLDRGAWLGFRRGGIGGSDAAAAVGLHPYQSALALWMDKTGRQGKSDGEQASDPKSPLFWGQLLEPTVADAYAQVTGRKVRRVNAILQHPDHTWMLANLDREVVGDPEVQLLEVKTTGVHEAWRWREGVPDHVQLQVMHQLAVTGHQRADVAVLIGGQQLEIHRVERDEAVIEWLIKLERSFWAYVEADTPPPADASNSADQALRKLYPSDRGQTVDFTEEPELSDVFAALQRVRDQLGTLQEDESRLKHQIQQAMGDASKAIFPTGRAFWKQSVASTRVDIKRLKADHPTLCAAYEETVPGSRRFTLRD